MGKKITDREAIDFLMNHDRFLILNHRRPDGDAVGSAAALCRGLRALGKTAWIWKNPQTLPVFQPYLDGLETEEAPGNAVVVSVDLSSESLLPVNAEFMRGSIELCLDHHGTNDEFAALSAVHPEAAACAELIQMLLQEMKGKPDRETAEALYLGICTDTGCFQYANVRPETFRCAALLMECGADVYEINRAMYGTKTLARLRLEAMLTRTARMYKNGEICICTVSAHDMDELDVTEADMDGIAGFPRDIEGVELGIMLRENEEGIRVSVRATRKYDAARLCGFMGGGGHKGAAGATLHGNMEEALQQILEVLIRAEILQPEVS